MLRLNRRLGRVVSFLTTLACVACSSPSGPSHRPGVPATGDGGAAGAASTTAVVLGGPNDVGATPVGAGAPTGVGALAVPDPVFKNRPAANALDEIYGYFPLTVNFNLCRSTDPDPGDQLRYTFDFDNDGTVDFRGTCRAAYTYFVPSSAKVCVSDRNPDGEVCKTYAIAPGPPVEDVACPLGVVNGSLSAGGPILANRLFRDDVASSCAGKAFPGVLSQENTYTVHNLGPVGDADTCVTVNWEIGGCFIESSYRAFPAAYAGAFDPADLSSGYLGDSGGSDSRPFSFVVPGGASLRIVVTSVGGPADCSYSFEVVSCSDPLT
jgi:hypothetical protein